MKIRSILCKATSYLPLAWLACAGCAPSLVAYDVALVVQRDCFQNAAGQVSCVPTEELTPVTQKVRWFIDETDSSAFVLLVHNGETIPGVYLPNNEQVASVIGCNGDGGTCFIARFLSDSFDTDTQCQNVSETLISLKVFSDDTGEKISGQWREARQSSANCSQPSAQEKVTNVVGRRATDAALSREEANRGE